VPHHVGRTPPALDHQVVPGVAQQAAALQRHAAVPGLPRFGIGDRGGAQGVRHVEHDGHVLEPAADRGFQRLIESTVNSGTIAFAD